MKMPSSKLYFAAVIAIAFSLMLPALFAADTVFAQEGPNVEPTATEPSEKPTATEPAPEPTETQPSPTQPSPTQTPTTVITSEPQPSEPVSIPEPVTVILFGTGLAALSAAAARRKKE